MKYVRSNSCHPLIGTDELDKRLGFRYKGRHSKKYVEGNINYLDHNILKLNNRSPIIDFGIKDPEQFYESEIKLKKTHFEFGEKNNKNFYKVNESVCDCDRNIKSNQINPSQVILDKIYNNDNSPLRNSTESINLTAKDYTNNRAKSTLNKNLKYNNESKNCYSCKSYSTSINEKSLGLANELSDDEVEIDRKSVV